MRTHLSTFAAYCSISASPASPGKSQISRIKSSIPWVNGSVVIKASLPYRAWHSGGLKLLRQHPICCLKVFSGIRDKRCVARVIYGFHSGDDLHPLWVMPMNVLDQFGLGVSRSGYENGARTRKRVYNGAKVIGILRSMPAPDGVGFVMNVSRRMIRMQNESFDVRWAELENTGFVVIDPDDGMVVMTVHD
jgi:hypothetical protein